VTLHLALSLTDGTEALSTFGEEPLTLTIGDGTLQPGLELALYGLRAGDRESLTLAPGQAYGGHDPAQVHEMLLADFPEPGALEPGQIIAFALPDGRELPGTVLEVGEEIARVDFNHPLAGREIVLRAEIIAVASPPAPGRQTE
jgi:FKBP-type peptidyl-prolyl cis-trans isomerase SlpA